MRVGYARTSTLDQKAGFLLRFDQWDPAQEPLGLEKLALNNMVQDPSMIHEQLAYMLFRDAGVPAPRSGYARVFVNGELYGLYATIEVLDNTELLELWYGYADGNLYEGEYGSDFYDDWVSSFDLDNGTDVGFADVQELTDAFDAMVTPATFLVDADLVIDADRYVDFAATEIWLGHWDGYAWTRNNYFIYRGLDTRWTFMPWGIDQTFWDYLPIWGGGGRVQQMCDASLPCREALADAFLGVSARVDALKLVAYADTLQALIDEAMQEDPRKEYDAGMVYWSIDMTQEFMLQRPGDVEAQLVCTDPTAVDEDGDGASGCGYDCDDDDPSVHPGAPEACNFQDDDCNGVLDDDPMCPDCTTSPAPDGSTLAYCFRPRNQAAAEFDCVAQGGHLVSIHDQATQDEVRDTAYSILPGNWWIGLSDVALEGTFVWSDDTPLDYTAWAGGEPNNAGGNENCGHLWDAAGGEWNDIPCNESMYYVCRLDVPAGPGGPYACSDESVGGTTGAAVAAGDTTGDDDDLDGSCGGAGGNDHVVTFTAPAAATYTFDTFGSAYDTKLALYSDCTSELYCNDDAGGGYQSQLVIEMGAGQDVLVVIDGYEGSTGAWVLNITQS